MAEPLRLAVQLDWSQAANSTAAFTRSLESAARTSSQISDDRISRLGDTLARVAQRSQQAELGLRSMAAAGDRVAMLTVQFERQAAQIENLRRQTGNDALADQALENIKRQLAQQLAQNAQTTQQVTQTTQQAAAATNNLSRATQAAVPQLIDMGVGLASGQNPLMILVQQLPQLAEGLWRAGVSGEAVAGVLGSIASVALPVTLAIGGLAYVYSQLADEIEKADQKLAAQNDRLSAAQKLADAVHSSESKLQIALGGEAKAKEESRLIQIDWNNKLAEANKLQIEQIGIKTTALRQAEKENRLLSDGTHTRDVEIVQLKADIERLTAEQAANTLAAEKGLEADLAAADAANKKAAADKAKADALRKLEEEEKRWLANLNLAMSEENRAAEASLAGYNAEIAALTSRNDKAIEAMRQLNGEESALRFEAHQQELLALQENYTQAMHIYASSLTAQEELTREYARTKANILLQYEQETAARLAKIQADAAKAQAETAKKQQEIFAQGSKDRQDMINQERQNAISILGMTSGFFQAAGDAAATYAERAGASEKQVWRIRQAAAIASAAIQIPQAILTALQTPPPLTAAAVALAAATGAAQLAAIVGAPPPSMRTGGIIGDSTPIVPASSLPDVRVIHAEVGEGVLSRQGVQSAGGEDGVKRLNSGAPTAPTILQLKLRHQVIDQVVAENLQRPTQTRSALRSIAGRRNIYATR